MTSKPRREDHNLRLRPTAVVRNGSLKAPETVAGESPVGGRIEISSKAIAHLATRTAQRTYGVVGVASRHARPGLAELLRRDEAYRGAEVFISDDRVTIELYVVLEFGTRISEVARNIMSSVKFDVESALGLPVAEVNVNVRDIRVSS